MLLISLKFHGNFVFCDNYKKTSRRTVMKAKLDVKKVKPKNKKQKEKAAKKRKHEDLDASSEDEGIHLKETRTSDEPVPKKVCEGLVGLER